MGCGGDGGHGDGGFPGADCPGFVLTVRPVVVSGDGLVRTSCSLCEYSERGVWRGGW